MPVRDVFRPLLTGSDERQSLRLRRWTMAILAYLVCYGFLIGFRYYELVTATPAELAGLLALLIGGNGVFYVLIKTDRNLRFPDPSLTEAQMLYSTAWSFLAIYYSHPIRAETVMVYVVVFFFGAFKLMLKPYLRVTACAVICYLLMIIIEQLKPPPGYDLRRELVRLTLLTCELLAISLMGGHLSRLRREFRKQQTELEQANATITRQASEDELTQTFNRRYLMTALAHEHARTRRIGQPYSLAILDLDHFKSINDRYGHQAGDNVLRSVASCLKTSLRGMDLMLRPENDELLARYGGEEFVLVLPDTGCESAIICLDRLRARVKELRFPDIDAQLGVSFSAGLAEARRDENPEQTLGRADAALYLAKADGRDRCRLAS